MTTTMKNQVAALTSAAQSIAAGYRVSNCYAAFKRHHIGGPLVCYYQLADQDVPIATPGAQSVEDALENLKDALWQAQIQVLIQVQPLVSPVSAIPKPLAWQQAA